MEGEKNMLIDHKNHVETNGICLLTFLNTVFGEFRKEYTQLYILIFLPIFII